MKYSISVQRKPFVFITYVKCTYTGEIIFVCVRRLVRSRRCSAHRRLSIDSRRVSVRLFDSTGNRERKRGKIKFPACIGFLFVYLVCIFMSLQKEYWEGCWLTSNVFGYLNSAFIVFHRQIFLHYQKKRTTIDSK